MRARRERPEQPLWRKISSFLIEMIVIVGVAAALPSLLSRALDTQYPLATITSSSMWPTLKRGDLVVVKGLRGDGVAVGQIVVFRNAEEGTMVIHRVVETDGAEVVTQGDANEEPDDPIDIADVVGVVPTVGDAPLRIPYLGQITLAVNGET
jgi:signal peptidase I